MLKQVVAPLDPEALIAAKGNPNLTPGWFQKIQPVADFVGGYAQTHNLLGGVANLASAYAARKAADYERLQQAYQRQQLANRTNYQLNPSDGAGGLKPITGAMMSGATPEEAQHLVKSGQIALMAKLAPQNLHVGLDEVGGLLPEDFYKDVRMGLTTHNQNNLDATVIPRSFNTGADESFRVNPVINYPKPPMQTESQPQPQPAHQTPQAQASNHPYVLNRFGPDGSGFGASRPGHQHNGLDTKVAEGTKLQFPFPAKVMQLLHDKLNGNGIRLDLGNGETVGFAHLRQLPGYKPGDIIQPGQLIGLSGNTGHSTGPHLHTTYRKNGVAMDPAQAFYGKPHSGYGSGTQAHSPAQKQAVQPTQAATDYQLPTMQTAQKVYPTAAMHPFNLPTQELADNPWGIAATPTLNAKEALAAYKQGFDLQQQPIDTINKARENVYDAGNAQNRAQTIADGQQARQAEQLKTTEKIANNSNSTKITTANIAANKKPVHMPTQKEKDENYLDSFGSTFTPAEKNDIIMEASLSGKSVKYLAQVKAREKKPRIVPVKTISKIFPPKKAFD